jgi:hypothetical protein
MSTGLFAGAELAQAWQKGLESWWSALLLDPRRLEQLAGRLSSLGLGALSGGPRDLAQVLRALELLEGRVSALEGQVKELAEGLGGVLALLSEGAAPRARKHPRTAKGGKR